MDNIFYFSGDKVTVGYIVNLGVPPSILNISFYQFNSDNFLTFLKYIEKKKKIVIK